VLAGKTVEGTSLASVRSVGIAQPASVVTGTTSEGTAQAFVGPEERPHLSCPPRQWLADPSTTMRTEARPAPSTLVPSSTVAG
jgi:hypothetical protein